MAKSLTFVMSIGLVLLLIMVLMIARDNVNFIPRFNHSNFNSDYSTINHFHVDLEINFGEKTINGSILMNITSNVKVLSVLDFDMHGQQIYSIFLSLNDKVINITTSSNIVNTTATNFGLGEKLSITLPENVSSILMKDVSFSILINFKSCLVGNGSNFLAPAQTFENKYDFFYTYSYPIHCREIFPIHDSLMLNATYSARIKVLSPLKVWMTAKLDRSESFDKFNIFYFTQSKAISAHYFNFIVGDLSEIKIDERNRIILVSEGEVLSKINSSLTNKLNEHIEIIEKKMFELPFKEMRIAIMPKGFPDDLLFNPELSYISHDFLNSDYFLENIIRIIINSYFGGQFGVIDWNLIFLLEGYASFIQLKILEDNDLKKNISSSKMFLNQTYETLVTTMDEFCKNNKPKCLLTELKPNLFGISPSEYTNYSFSLQKGLFFFLELERLLNRTNFLNFTLNFIQISKWEKISHVSFTDNLVEFLDWNSTFALLVRKQIPWSRWWLKKNDLPFNGNLTSESIQTAYDYSIEYLNCFENNCNKTLIEEINSFADRIKVAFFNFLEKEANILIQNNKTIIQSYIQKIDQDFNVSTSGSSESCIYRFQFLKIKSNVFKENELLDFYQDFDHYFNDCYRKEQVIILFQNLHLNSPKMAAQLYFKNKDLFHLKIQKILIFLESIH